MLVIHHLDEALQNRLMLGASKLCIDMHQIARVSRCTVLQCISAIKAPLEDAPYRQNAYLELGTLLLLLQR